SLRLRLGASLSLIFAFACISSLRAQEAATLESGPSVVCEIAGGSKCSYQINMTAGQYARVMGRQNGIDVGVELFSADSGEKVDYDSEIKTNGEEPVDFVATTPGIYRLTVSAKYERLPAGRCEIRLLEQRAATENDKLIYEARRLRTEWRRL